MTPNELLAREPESVEHDPGCLQGHCYDFLPELPCNLRTRVGEIKKEGLFGIRVFKHFDFDGRRYWRLAAVYYRGTPVMITQNAGREGDDHSQRFILSGSAYFEMISYLWSKVAVPNPDAENRPAIVGLEDDIDVLDEFYGGRLDGHFERSWR